MEDFVDAAIQALRSAVQQRDELRAMIQVGIDEADRGELREPDFDRIRSLGQQFLATLKD